MQVLGVDDLIEQIAASLGIPAEMPLQAENRMRMEVRKECEGSIREKYLSELREEIAGIKEQTEKLLEPGIVMPPTGDYVDRWLAYGLRQSEKQLISRSTIARADIQLSLCYKTRSVAECPIHRNYVPHG